LILTLVVNYILFIFHNQEIMFFVYSWPQIHSW